MANTHAVGTAAARPLGIIFSLVAVIIGIESFCASVSLSQPAPQDNSQFSTMLSALPDHDGTSLYTYYGPTFATDGHIIEPRKPKGENFLACDKTLLVVADLTKLKKTNRPDCAYSPSDDPSVLSAYIDSIKPNGYVVLRTTAGTKNISRENWQLLVSEPGNQFDKPLGVGDYAAFATDDEGKYKSIYRLAPTKYQIK